MKHTTATKKKASRIPQPRPPRPPRPVPEPRLILVTAHTRIIHQRHPIPSRLRMLKAHLDAACRLSESLGENYPAFLKRVTQAYYHDR